MSIKDIIKWCFDSPSTLGSIYHMPSGNRIKFKFENPETEKPVSKFLFSVGQSDPNPPFNQKHTDSPDTFTNILPGKISYFPRFFAEFTVKISGENLVFRFLESGLGLSIVVEGVPDIKVSFEQNGNTKKFITPFKIFIRVFADQTCEFEQSYEDLSLEDIEIYPELHSIFWNITLDKNGNYYCPVSKGWVKFIAEIYNEETESGPLIFNWDQSFAAILCSKRFPQLGEHLLTQQFELLETDGRLPQLKIGNTVTDITNPPVIFMSLAASFLYSKNTGFLQNYYPDLIDILNWWEKNRTVPWNKGLFTWGGESSLEAGLESGWDNSPLWNEYVFNKSENRFETACPMATGYMIMAYRIMEILSLVLKKEEMVSNFKKRRKEIINAVEEDLWSDKLQGYFPVHKSGEFVEIITPSIYFPGFSGELDPDRFVKALRFLQDPEILGGEFPIPTLSRSHPEFNGDGDYWRGRIWPPINFLTIGAVAAFSEDLAMNILKSSIGIFKDNYQKNISGENYSSETGKLYPQPGIYSRNCPIYIWGGLMNLNPVLLFKRLKIFS